MEIKLSHKQWKQLKGLVMIGARVELKFGMPVELKCNGESIEIKSDEVKIVVEDI